MNNNIIHPETSFGIWDRSKSKNFGVIVNIGIDFQNDKNKRLYVDSLYRGNFTRYYINQYEFPIFALTIMKNFDDYMKNGKLKPSKLSPETVKQYEHEIMNLLGNYGTE